jgi:hypothetical protein
MKKCYRRYEVLLPLQFNDGRPVPEALVAQTLREFQQTFGAVSCETQTIRGLWQHGGKIYRDDLIRLFVDVEDSPENFREFKRMKNRLKRRFKQLDIWITTYPIDVV